KRYLLDNHIVTMSLKPQNILCQRISESEVVPVVCDNLGESTFTSGMKLLADLDVWVVDASRLSVEEIRSISERHKQEHPNLSLI
ncbi:YrbL family protein, partial [Salmonella enterica subsp. enterica serovar Anatum]|nr:YrbL family protein [Salmonella enterica subsp. enterica serovar Anatum]